MNLANNARSGEPFGEQGAAWVSFVLKGEPGRLVGARCSDPNDRFPSPIRQPTTHLAGQLAPFYGRGRDP